MISLLIKLKIKLVLVFLARSLLELKGAAGLKSRFAPVPGSVSVLPPETMPRSDKASSNILEVEFERPVQK